MAESIQQTFEREHPFATAADAAAHVKVVEQRAAERAKQQMGQPGRVEDASLARRVQQLESEVRRLVAQIEGATIACNEDGTITLTWGA